MREERRRQKKCDLQAAGAGLGHGARHVRLKMMRRRRPPAAAAERVRILGERLSLPRAKGYFPNSYVSPRPTRGFFPGARLPAPAAAAAGV